MEERTEKRPVRVYVIAFVLIVAVALCAYFLYGFLSSGAGGGGGEPPVTSPPIVYTTSSSATASDGTTATTLEDVPPEEAYVRREGVYTVLLLGVDKGYGSTDVMMLAVFDTVNDTVNVLNIPRDTYSNAAQNREKWLSHLNQAYAYSKLEGLRKEIIALVGYDFDRYVRIDMNGFVKLINYIGGVEHDVPINMNYTDPDQNLSIRFNKGRQYLNGKQALEFVRYRSTASADIGRIERRDDFLFSVFDTLKKPSNVAKAAEIAGLLFDNTETDCTLDDLLFFAKQGLEVDKKDIVFKMLPGEGSRKAGEGYWIPYKNELLAMINEFFNPFTTPIKDIDIVERSENKGK